MLKSVVEVDIKDGAFAKFAAAYDRYRKALKSEPEAWKLVNDKIAGTRSSFDKIVDDMVATNVQQKLIAKAQEEADRRTERMEGRWSRMAGNAKAFAGHVRDSTLSLLKWGGIVGLGLLGGGLFGIDRLALGAAAARRSSLGLGASIGGARSFDVNFARLVDPASFLGAVSGAKTDLNRRTGLIGAGLSSAEIGGSTEDTAVALLRNLKRIADTTAPALFAQVLQSRRLDQFASPEDLQRLRNTAPGEFNDLVRRYRQGRSDFDVPPDVSRKWQEFTTQLSRAGQGIENTFIRGLAPLAPGLTKLSEGVESAVRTFLQAPKLKEWMDDLGTGLEKFAKYVVSDDFQTAVKDFVEGLGTIGAGIAKVAKWFGDPDRARESDERAARVKKLRDERAAGGASAWEQLGRVFNGSGTSPVNNPGNLRPAGQSTGFQTFATPEEGLRAMARQLQIYGTRDHLDTISDIVSKYAPKSENDTASYIKDVARKTGFSATDHLDLGNRDVLARLVAAMVSHEQRPGSYDRYKDAKVVVEVFDKTGGNTAVSVNALKN